MNQGYGASVRLRVTDNRHRDQHANQDDMFMSMHDRTKRNAEARAQRVEEREDAQPTGYEQEKEETQKKEAPFDDAQFGALLEEETLEVREDGSVLYPDYAFNSHPYGRDAMQVHEVSLPSYFIGIGTMEPYWGI